MAESLLSPDQAHLLDLIDSLTTLGIQHEVALLQLIVCGDQSVGKSSLLESISGIKFSTKVSQCTRFVTQVSLRRSSQETYRVQFRPGGSASVQARNRFTAFTPKITSIPDISETIMQATEVMD